MTLPTEAEVKVKAGRLTHASNHSSCRSYTDSQVRDPQQQAVIFKTLHARLARGRQQVREAEAAELVQGQIFVEAAALEELGARRLGEAEERVDGGRRERPREDITFPVCRVATRAPRKAALSWGGVSSGFLPAPVPKMVHTAVQYVSVRRLQTKTRTLRNFF